MFEEKNKVATITLNRPEAYNAISDTMRTELRTVIDHIHASEDIRVVVLTGAGPVFCAGGDIKLMKQRLEADISYRQRLETYRMDVAGMVKEIRSIRQPLIAQINGGAYGAGCSIAMLCDVRIAAATAKFGLPFGKRGLIPDWGATYFLPRLVGASNAIALTSTGKSFDAAEALRIGFVNKVVEPDQLQECVNAFCAEIVKNSPLAVMKGKAAMYAGLDAELDTVLESEAQLQSMCYRSNDHREGVDCF
ncbi:MAG: enoyl-CoA hydratase/isomerase family protein, partial [Sporomusa sp.]